MARKLVITLVLVALTVLLAAPTIAQDEFVFGIVLVGPDDDSGWSQAHFEGGQYVVDHVPGTRMLTFENLNSAATPDKTLQDVVGEFVAEGAQLIFTTSDAFEEDTNPVAEAFPDVTFINISGDDVLTSEAPPNVGNLMGQMEWGKLMAGCAAGLATQTGSIGYLGPLINGETRRLAASAYLGARYCYEHYRGLDADELIFTVIWIGYWLYIPDFTLNPTEVTDTFFDDGADVVISGIDTPEAIITAGQRAAEGEQVYAVPYDYQGACDRAPEVCLGVPYFHWGPDYLKIVEAVMGGTWTPSWDWVEPGWADINDPDNSAIGFLKGDGLSEEASASMDSFIADLSAYATNPFVPNSIALWQGPLAKQDGAVLAEDGQLVDPLDIWYLDQLLLGMVGASS
jgi:simple sugar transport system substrate-binding protein